MNALLRFLPLLISRGGYVIAFVAGIAATALTILPLAKGRAYDAGYIAGKVASDINHAGAISRARDARDDRTARQIEDRINAENDARRPAAGPGGVRHCGPAIRDCPARDGAPR